MRTSRGIAASVFAFGLAALSAAQPGCTSGFGALHVARRPDLQPRPVVENPIVIPSSDPEAVWNKTIAVVDRYFDIASENRLSRTIITQPKIGATLLEPWSGDSVGFNERLESTLQTIRRFAIVKIDPAPAGGYLVKVEVRKELEDMVKPDRQAAGRAVFNNDFPVNRSPGDRRSRPGAGELDPQGTRPRAGTGHPGPDPRCVLPLRRGTGPRRLRPVSTRDSRSVGWPSRTGVGEIR